MLNVQQHHKGGYYVESPSSSGNGSHRNKGRCDPSSTTFSPSEWMQHGSIPGTNTQWTAKARAFVTQSGSITSFKMEMQLDVDQKASAGKRSSSVEDSGDERIPMTPLKSRRTSSTQSPVPATPPMAPLKRKRGNIKTEDLIACGGSGVKPGAGMAGLATEYESKHLGRDGAWHGPDSQSTSSQAEMEMNEVQRTLDSPSEAPPLRASWSRDIEDFW